MKGKIFFAALTLLASSLTMNLKGQMDQLSFIYGPNGDARILLEQYLKPYSDILGSNLNAAWYNTAKTHKIGGLDITGMLSLTFAPPEVLQYDLRMITGLSGNYEGSDFAPTALGSLADRPVISSTAEVVNAMDELETRELASYVHPDGNGRDFLPLQTLQMSVGLVFGTEVTARFSPMLDLRTGSEIGMWGVGGKHSVSQWIPIIKKLKFIDIAVQGGYTKVTSSSHQSLSPIAEIDPFPDFNWDDQFLLMNVSGWTVNFIASQTLAVVTLYEGIGWASSSALVGMTGHYAVNEVVSDPASTNFGSTTFAIAENPVEDLLIEGYSGLRINAGLRLKLGVFTLHYDFTRTQYISHTGGIGVTFR